MRKDRLRILVTGATGTLGREVMKAGSVAGYTMRGQSRRGRRTAEIERTAKGHEANQRIEWVRADLATGAGVSESLRDVHVVIHAATDPQNARAVDQAGTEHLLEEAKRHRIGHLIYASIVGIDVIPLPYYAHKLAAERTVTSGPVRYSIVRFTQFHTLIASLIEAANRLPFVLLLPKRLRFQSVAPAEAATRLIHCIERGPSARLKDFGGPQILTLEGAAATWKRVRRIRKLLLPVPAPGQLAKAFRSGGNIARGGDRGSVTWEQWLRSSAD